MFACGTGSYQPVCAFIQLGARGKVRGTLARHVPTVEVARDPQHIPIFFPSEHGGEGSPEPGTVASQPATVPAPCMASLHVARSSPGVAEPGCPMGTGPGLGSPCWDSVQRPAHQTPSHSSPHAQLGSSLPLG